MARSATRHGGSSTGTLTLPENPSVAPFSSSRPPETIVLRLSRPKKKVTWKEGTVDNEFLGRKSSKKCCIFHKQKPFDEDASDDDSVGGCGDGDGSNVGVDKGHGAGASGCCSSHHGGGHQHGFR